MATRQCGDSRNLKIRVLNDGLLKQSRHMGIWIHPIAYLVFAGYSYRKTGIQNMRIPVYRKDAALRTMHLSSESALEFDVGSRQAAFTSFFGLENHDALHPTGFPSRTAPA